MRFGGVKHRIAASFSKNGMKDDMLGAFMMSSILLNPQLLIYSAALGTNALIIRFNMSLLCGFLAGVLIKVFYKNKSFFNFEGLQEKKNKDTEPNIFKRLLKNIGRNIKATGLYFLFGIVLTVLFQMYVPQECFANLFGSNNGFGVLMAATSFMITGPATKITNLGALKIVLGLKHFIIYLAYVILFALLSGIIIDLVGITI